jgi:hypothetical protein
MLITGISGDGNLLIVTRAVNGTTAAAHAAGAAVTVLTDYAVNRVPTCTLVPCPPASPSSLQTTGHCVCAAVT